MARIKGVVVQGGADTFTSDTIDTNMTVDGRVGWEITRFKAYWSNGYSLDAVDSTVNALLSTQSTITTMDQDEELARINFSVANTAGIAVAYPVDILKEAIIFGSRITVQPTLYVHAASAGSGQANALYYEIEYELVKLTDLEVMRLLIGGA